MPASTQSERRAAYENYLTSESVHAFGLVTVRGPGGQVMATHRGVLTSASW